jgi:hypothetical protein
MASNFLTTFEKFGQTTQMVYKLIRMTPIHTQHADLMNLPSFLKKRKKVKCLVFYSCSPVFEPMKLEPLAELLPVSCTQEGITSYLFLVTCASLTISIPKRRQIQGATHKRLQILPV